MITCVRAKLLAQIPPVLSTGMVEEFGMFRPAWQFRVEALVLAPAQFQKGDEAGPGGLGDGDVGDNGGGCGRAIGGAGDLAAQGDARLEGRSRRRWCGCRRSAPG